ncbi:MAG: chitin deacetylase [Alphaproteobacteria bacterium]|nr:chitin deacetylase [Alphaproteobacteria bacterium]
MAAPQRDYPRDLVGYGRNMPNAQWPGGARVAVNLNLNYEAGSELSLLHGDDRSEAMLGDTGFPGVPNARSVLVESAFEYGTRRGVWRVLRMFEERKIRCSVLACVFGFYRTPEVVAAMLEAGHEIVSHGWRWIDYQHMPEAEERAHIAKAMKGLRDITGKAPVGWMTGRPSPNTRRLLVEHGGLLYDRDALNDELPYWVEVGGKPHLVIPYSYETNDNRCDLHWGLATSDDIFSYWRDAFDLLHEEGADEPKMMSIGLHDRVIGRPGRAVGLARFLDHVQNKGAWICTGEEIARHWMAKHPHKSKT